MLTACLLCADASGQPLFPDGLPLNEWVEFECNGFGAPVSGTILTSARPTCCGVPLGGVGTGCLDIEVGGVLGFESMFNQFPRQPQLLRPFLGLSVSDRVFVLADREYLAGGRIEGCVEPNRGTQPTKGRDWHTRLAQVTGVMSPEEIRYFGHFPVADLAYRLAGPLDVELRAWSPFLPGDLGASNLPAAVFEVRVRNTSSTDQSGSLAFSFPGIPSFPVLHEGKHDCQRKRLANPVNGVAIEGPNGIGYVLGVLGGQKARVGGDLNRDSKSWSGIGRSLPPAAAGDSGASVAVDLQLAAGETTVVRFVLAWYSPTFIADKDRRYTNRYATRYDDAVAVARRVARDHKDLLNRVLAWQEVIYRDRDLPPWLKDGLIQTLCLIPETSYWAAARGPLGDWCYPEGYFAMNESPRGCSHIECIPCTYYGGLPVTYFFPTLNRTTLRAYTRFIRKDGAAPFDLGPCCNEVALVTPGHNWQKALNGVCYVSLVDRLWQRTGDRSVLDEFYDGVKRTTEYTVKMSENHGADAVVSIPDDVRSEWWEGFDWYGMTAHAGGLRISNMAIALRMAETVGDRAFAEQCTEWLRQGQASMEGKMWNEAAGSYLLYYHEKLGKRDDTIMSNQFDGEWNNDFHGLPGIHRKDRIDRALHTIGESCRAPYGAVSFARAKDLKPLITYGIFPPEIMMLAFTYLYEGRRETGLEVLRDCLHNLFIKHGHTWDLPNTVSGKLTFTKKTEDGREGYAVEGVGTGEGQRTYGTDYYQNMMLWAAPAAIKGQDIAESSKPGGLIDRIVKAARAKD